MNKGVLLFTLVAVLSIISSSVLALEITPTKRSLAFTPGIPTSGSLTIANTDDSDLTVAISARGELANYLAIDEFITTLPKGSASKTISYTLTLPENYSAPGQHEAEIIVVAKPNTAKPGGATVSTTLSLSTKVIVRIPYPGKYAEARIEIEEADVGEPVIFLIPVSNLGGQDIVAAKATIGVLGPTNNRIASVQTPIAPIRSGTAHELIGEWVANVDPGVYVADAAITYDGELAQAKRSFAVGSLLIDVLSVSTGEFRLGGIAKISLVLRNTWNNPVDDVYVRLVIYNEQDQIIYDTKSSSIDLPPLSIETAQVFWDTAGLRAGSYRGELTVNYADRTTERDISFILSPTSLEALLTGQVISNEKASAEVSSFSLLSLVLIAIIALVVINLALFFYMRRTIGRIGK